MSRRASVIAALLALAALPARATAGEFDAGAQSLFSSGAGVRALGMGGAYVATAADASALIWNPAGLGRVPRGEFQAVQTSGLTPGFQALYASFVMPDWRWGAVGVTTRYFGSSGIEQRDDRDQLLGSSLTDSELETTFGFGHTFARMLSAGATVKLQRQSLAGYAANGVGADLGVQFSPADALGDKAGWAAPFTWALSVRNAIEPSLKLDRESVPDPRIVRGGMAARFGFVTPVLAELDFEAPRMGAAKLKAGAEWEPYPGFALRGGIGASSFSAGSGFRWGHVAVDYAYENTGLDPLHRVGVSLAFGRTVDDTRLAARRAEDAALERRVADAFNARQGQQLAELLDRADRARQRADWEGALDALAAVTAIDPKNTRALSLTLACQVGRGEALEGTGDLAGAILAYEQALTAAPDDTTALAGRERCRALSDQKAQRTEELRGRYQRALQALAADSLVVARDGFASVVRDEPTDAEAASMLERARRLIAQQAAQLIDQAHRYTRGQLYGDAGKALDRVRALDASAPGLADAAAALKQALEAEAAKVPAPTARPSTPLLGGHAGDAKLARTTQEAPIQMTDRQVDQLYKQALAALNARRNGDALKLLEVVWMARPGYEQVTEYLKREYLAQGMDAFASGRLQQAVDLWERALLVDPTDTKARSYLDRAQKQLLRSREILGGNP